ncbi:MAG: glycosyltransferase [Ardenticatenaceae bacterium]
MKAVVITPTYNEAKNIGLLIPQILAQDRCLEVLVVDDNSPDGTGQIADKMAVREPRIHVLHHTRKEGLGPAYVAGFKWALAYGADLIFEMDADLSHHPKYLPAFLRAIEDSDMVLGSRYVKGGGTQNWPLSRQLISQGGSLYARAILGVNVRDLTGGFKCFRRQVLETINLDGIQANGYGFQVELTYRALQAGFRISEIPITFVDREHGESKMTSGIALEAISLMWKLRFGPTIHALPTPQELLPSTNTRRSLKILLVVSEAPPIKSGIARVAAGLKSGLEGQGHQVDTLSSLDIPRYNFGEVRLSTFLFHWWKVRRQIANYDLINVHAPVPTFVDFFLLLASQFGLSPRRGRIVLTYQCEIDLPGLVSGPLSRHYSALHKQMARLVGHTIVTSPSYAQMFEGTLPREKLSIIPWAVNQDAFGASIAEKSKDMFRILFIGQLRPYKGLDVLLRSMASLPGTQLNVIGGGHHAEAYHQLSEDLNLTNVNFLGKVSDRELQEALKGSHVLVLPSRTKAEAFGIVLLEAMAAGCVPISSNLPGVRDVVGQVGFTFPIGDSNALMQHLTYLRDHPEVVDRYARQAQAKARRYSWERTTEAHERLFRKIIVQEEIKEAVKVGKRIEVAILETLSAHLAASSSALYEGDQEAYELERRVIYGQNLQWPKDVVYQKGILGFVMEQEGTMLLPNDVQNTYLAEALGCLAGRSTLTTIINTPEQLQLLFCFSRATNQRLFTTADRRWLEKIAGLLTTKREERDRAPLPIAKKQLLGRVATH